MRWLVRMCDTSQIKSADRVLGICLAVIDADDGDFVRHNVN